MPECPSDLQLTLYAARALPEAAARALSEHVLACPHCGEAVEQAMLLHSLDAAALLPSVTLDEAARAVDVLRGYAAPMADEPGTWLRKFFKGMIGGLAVLKALEGAPALAQDVRLELAKGDRSQIVDHLCALRCEYIVLRECGVEVDEETLLREAVAHGWFDPARGTPLDCLGRLLELHGLRVERRLRADMSAVGKALMSGHRTIVAVDQDELRPGSPLSALWEKVEDYLVQVPNHCLMVLGTVTGEDHREYVVVADPAETTQRVTLPLREFLDAWADSQYYLLVAYRENA